MVGAIGGAGAVFLDDALEMSPIAVSLQFGTGDFSIGFRYRVASYTGISSLGIIEIGSVTGSNTSWLVIGFANSGGGDLTSASPLGVTIGEGSSIHSMGIGIGAAGTTHYGFICRQAGTWYAAIDGVEGTPWVNATPITSPSTDIGYIGGCFGGPAQLDDIWVVKGDAQYPARVTPPVAEFTYA